MLGANLICFQTYSYSRHFTSSCIRVCGYESTGKGIDNQGHVTTVSHCPVGVDAERIAQDVAEATLRDPRVRRVRVRVEKLDVLPGSVGVEIEREAG